MEHVHFGLEILLLKFDIIIILDKNFYCLEITISLILAEDI